MSEMTMKVDFEKKDDRSIWEKLFDDAMDHADVNSITSSMIKRRGMIARYIVEHYEEYNKRREEMNMQEMIDREILNDIIRKNNEKFARKWSLATICIAVPSAVKAQLERDFMAAHPDLDFEEEWSKCLEEVADKRFEPIVSTMTEAARRSELL